MASEPSFRYDGFDVQPRRGLLTCRYSLGDWRFEEQFSLSPDGPESLWASPAVADAARLVFLLAGVSYYKTAAPPVIDLGETAVTDGEREFLRRFFHEGLGEFAYRNGIDLSGIRIEGPAASAPATRRHNLRERGTRPLIPFGGGIDSIVTVELVRQRHPDSALFIMNRPGDRFAAIERPAQVTGLPIVRAERQIDPQLSADARSPAPQRLFRNGHVPVTGILSSVAVLAAVLDDRDAVVMSNEWSASKPTIELGDLAINHQYSKSAAFEADFRAVLGDLPAYFSALRPRTELWVAEQFARLSQYHDSFHSCNRAFYLDPASGLDHWCGECDKCAFIDLILAPFMPAADLRGIFRGAEPLDNLELLGRFQSLLGTGTDMKPFECVGDVQECQVAVRMAVVRPDRADTALLHLLAKEIENQSLPPATELLEPIGEHFVPDDYAI